MKTSEIRNRFLDYFVRQDHTLVPSASLVIDDPNLLFVNAGMVPFVPFYLGQQTPPYKRATSVQKCIRTLDIDEVGKTTRHGTFFQMNGNFSFGDYFKEGAMRFAWELVTGSESEGGLGFDESRLWVSIYQDDDEAADLWQHKIGISPDRIVRLGMADNYWSMGVAGPCGPDSEIFFDRGPAYGPDGGPGAGADDRFLEIWNLVFMEKIRADGGDKAHVPVIGELPQKNIDTGMGLERVAYLLQGVDNLYEIDEVYPVIDRAAELTGRRYGANHDDDVRFRVIGDHVRTALMLIGDGVVPGNEAQGYVLRRIIRRAVRAIRLLGVQEPVLPELLPVSRDCMKASYPDVETDFGRISEFAYQEEDAFLRTLHSGTTILDTAVGDLKSGGGTQLSGERAFRLHDTYGFPIELTLEMAAEQGVSVDEEEFRRLMTEQRTRAKADALEKKTGLADMSVYRQVLDEHGPSEFTGYAEVAGQPSVLALLRGTESVPVAGVGDEIGVVLDATPFYAEAGGQQADYGTLVVDGGELEVTDVQKPVPGLIVHTARVTRGEVRVGDLATAQIDVARRRAVSRAHTATHLVHKAVRNALGDSAHQAGSLNAPGRMRFDYTAPGTVPANLIADVEAEVNGSLGQDLDVQAYITTLDEARKLGAMALFGEKYGNEVRVVDIGEGYSRELCAGTHVLRSAQLGMVKLVADGSIGSGVRRVEALVGQDAFDYLSNEHLLVSQLATTLKARPEEVPDRVNGLLERLRVAEHELAGLRSAQALSGAAQLAGAAKHIGDIAFVGARVPDGVSANDLRSLATEVRGRLDGSAPGVVALLGASDGKVSFVVATNDRARDRGVTASDVVRALAPAVDGRGGGKPDMAQGGGTNPAGIDAAIAAVEEQLRVK
jgi:alanyl-tRNA synthetase